MTKRLPLVLSNSGIATFRRCPREYFFRYELRREAKTKGRALRFGTLFHVGLNAWWGAPADRFQAGLAAMLAHAEAEGVDDLDLVKARTLLLGYSARWEKEEYETFAVEKKFEIDMGRDVTLRGAIDALARVNGVTRVVEHKTSSRDISGGSDYWRQIVTMDPQVSTYLYASNRLSMGATNVLYDVVRKPNFDPFPATPPELRKYTKPTKSEPTPRLYANQREEAETLEEYEKRLISDITEKPEFYFARMTIVRLPEEHERHIEDTLMTANAIRFAQETSAFPRNPNSCMAFNRPCDFMPVCEGAARIDDDNRYQDKEERT